MGRSKLWLRYGWTKEVAIPESKTLRLAFIMAELDYQRCHPSRIEDSPTCFLHGRMERLSRPNQKLLCWASSWLNQGGVRIKWRLSNSGLSWPNQRGTAIESGMSSRLNWKLSLLPSSWPNPKGHHGWIKEFSTCLRFGWIGGFIMVEWNGHHNRIENFLGLGPSWKNQRGVAAKSKTFDLTSSWLDTFRLGFIMAQLGRCHGRIQDFPIWLRCGPIREVSQPNWRLSDLTSPSPNRRRHYDESKTLRLNFIMVESKRSSQPNWSLSNSHLSCLNGEIGVP